MTEQTETKQEGPGMSMKHVTCIADLRQLHKRRVPKAFFDYADRGSYTEDTLRANRMICRRSSSASAFWSTSRSATSDQNPR